MSDHERGAYAPPTDTPLSFDARQPVRGARPIPFTLIISILVLAGLAAAIFVFYQSGVRRAGQPPQAVGQPVAGMKAPPPAEGQPQDPAAGLQIYKTEGGLQPATAPPKQKTTTATPSRAARRGTSARERQISPSTTPQSATKTPAGRPPDWSWIRSFKTDWGESTHSPATGAKSAKTAVAAKTTVTAAIPTSGSRSWSRQTTVASSRSGAR